MNTRFSASIQNCLRCRSPFRAPTTIICRFSKVVVWTRVRSNPCLRKSDAVRWSFDLRYNPIGQPTGRGAFPGFVARSRQHPESELHDPAVWDQLWSDARDNLANRDMGKFNRWNAENPVCA